MTIGTLFVLAVAVTARPTSSPKAEPLPVAPGVTGEIAYAPDNLLFIFRGDGDPKGTFVVQARPGLPSEAPSAAPIVVAFENRPYARCDSLLARAAHTRRTPKARGHVNVSLDRKKGQWTTQLSIPFRHRLNDWPFSKDGRRRPPPWCAAVTYRDGDGKEHAWGTAEDPLVISWKRSASFASARDALFRDRAIVGEYYSARWKYNSVFDFSQKERWIGFRDPGIETFVWRQADSERLFHERYARKVYESSDGLVDLLDDWGGNRKAKILERAEPARQRAFDGLGGLVSASEALADARRRYLLDRFMGRELPPVVPERARAEESVKVPLVPDIDGDDAGEVTLDDEELEF